MDPKKPIIFYDIASGPPVRCFAPNPWKTRYALNFKGVHYQTEWVELPDVTSVRKRLGVAANRTLRDGSPFYTLPIIKDNEEVVGDSFEIALYLDKICGSQGPMLFPPATVGLQRAFNLQVDAIFTQFVILCTQGMPFNPATADVTKATMLKRFGPSGITDWKDLTVRGEERTQKLEEFKAALGELAKPYSHTDGPLLDVNVTYADIIVGAWLQYVKTCLPASEWEAVQTWHGGLWKNIHEALQPYAENK